MSGIKKASKIVFLQLIREKNALFFPINQLLQLINLFSN